jgi:hypothetical protein
LVIERLADPLTQAAYPGQVFAEPEREYTEAMQAFVAASQPQQRARGSAVGSAGTSTR